MKLSGAVRNYWANELPAAAGVANHRAKGWHSLRSDSEQFDEDLYSCNNFHVKKSAFRTINLLSQTTRFDNI